MDNQNRKAWLYLLPALPFLARIFYYAPYHTVDFTLTADMLTATAVPLAILLALLESALWYGAFLLLAYLYRRFSKDALTEESIPLCAASLPLVYTLVTVLFSLVSAFFGTDFWGGTLLGYLLELALALAAAVLSYFTVRYVQKNI